MSKENKNSKIEIRIASPTSGDSGELAFSCDGGISSICPSMLPGEQHFVI
jgi:hypothetical protein